MTPDELLRIAASLDQASKHIIAQTIVAEARGKGLALAIPTEVVETPGEGISGRVEGRAVMVGGLHFIAGKVADAGLVDARGANGRPARWRSAVAVDGKFAGVLILSDELRAGTEATAASRCARSASSASCWRPATATRSRTRSPAGLSIDLVRSELTPDQKILVVLSERKNGPVMMIGDGVNDAPALAAADIGLAMGAKGAAASAEAADVVLLVDQLDRVLPAIRIARRSRFIALQSVIAGMGLSILAMIAAAFGSSAAGRGRAAAGGDRRRGHLQRAAGAEGVTRRAFMAR